MDCHVGLVVHGGFQSVRMWSVWSVRVLVLVAWLHVVTATDELLANPGFETDNPAYDWKCGSDKCSYERHSGDSFTGNFSGKVYARSVSSTLSRPASFHRSSAGVLVTENWKTTLGTSIHKHG